MTNIKKKHYTFLGHFFPKNALLCSLPTSDLYAKCFQVTFRARQTNLCSHLRQSLRGIWISTNRYVHLEGYTIMDSIYLDIYCHQSDWHESDMPACLLLLLMSIQYLYIHGTQQLFPYDGQLASRLRHGKQKNIFTETI